MYVVTILKMYSKLLQPLYFLLDIGGISSVDYTACVALSSMAKNLKEEHGVKMGLVSVSGKALVYTM